MKARGGVFLHGKGYGKDGNLLYGQAFAGFLLLYYLKVKGGIEILGEVQGIGFFNVNFKRRKGLKGNPGVVHRYVNVYLSLFSRHQFVGKGFGVNSEEIDY